jgi:acetyl esterase/lipase
VPVTLTRYDGMIHGFIRMPALVAEADFSLGQIASAVDALPPAGATSS